MPVVIDQVEVQSMPDQPSAATAASAAAPADAGARIQPRELSRQLRVMREREERVRAH